MEALRGNSLPSSLGLLGDFSSTLGSWRLPAVPGHTNASICPLTLASLRRGIGHFWGHVIRPGPPRLEGPLTWDLNTCAKSLFPYDVT